MQPLFSRYSAYESRLDGFQGPKGDLVRFIKSAIFLTADFPETAKASLKTKVETTIKCIERQEIG